MRNTGFLLAVALLLASAPTDPAWGQRRVVPANRGGAGVVRGGSDGRTVVAPPRSNPRGRVTPRAAHRPADRFGESEPRDRGRESRPWGRDSYGRHDPYGRYDSYPRYPRYPGAYAPHHGLHVGARFGDAFVILVAPVAYPVYLYPAPYVIRYSAGGAKTLLRGDLGGAADALAVERLADGVLRLSWVPDGRVVEEVGLFLADAGQQVLAVQTLRTPPWSALFEPTRQAAYVGITIAYADGQRSTTLLPLR